MTTAIHRQVEACRAGTEPALVVRMTSGWAVMSNTQVLRGYCVLLPDPVVPHLNALTGAVRATFFDDLGRLGDAVLETTNALRINYAIFGNLEPALHAHVIPRYADEPEAYRTANPWAYDWTRAPRFEPSRDGDLLQRLRDRLATR
jgi:diadenosine tetraphosphate (Ap4A) HIT family hydrolase